MNSTKPLSDNKRWSDAPFFRFTLTQNWQHFALYLILALLVMLVPTAIIIDEYRTSTFKSFDLAEVLETVGQIGVFLSSVLAVLAGMSAMSYINSKRDVGCYHSFPIRREQMFFTESLTRVIYYLISIACGFLSALAVFRVCFAKEFAEGAENGDAVLLYGKLALSAVILFLFLYAAFLLAGSLAGTGVMKFFLTLAILFLPLIAYSIFVELAAIDVPDLMDSYYLSERVVRWFCPLLRLLYGISGAADTDFVWVFSVIPEIVLYTVAAVLLYKFRKSELAGTTVVYKPVFHVLKSVLILLAGLGSALIFGSNFLFGGDSSVFRMFLGALFGLVIAFLLVNCVFYRSAKSMFADVRAFLVIALVTVCVIVAVPLNVFHLFGNPYSADQTKEVTVECNSIFFTPEEGRVTFTDPAILEMVSEALKSDDKRFGRGVTSYSIPLLDPEMDENIARLDPVYRLDCDDAEITYEYGSAYREKAVEPESSLYDLDRNCMLQIVQKPKFGIPYAVIINVSTSGELWKTLMHAQETQAAYDLGSWITPESIEELEFRLDDRSMNYDSTTIWYDVSTHGEEYFIDPSKAWGTDEMDALYRVVTSYHFREEYAETSPVVGSIMVYFMGKHGRVSASVPVYAADLDTINRMTAVFAAVYNTATSRSEEPIVYGSTLDYYASQMDRVDFFLMVDTETGRAQTVGESLVLALADSTESFLSENNLDWNVRRQISKGPGRYLLLAGIEDGEDIRIRFRPDTVTDGEIQSWMGW